MFLFQMPYCCYVRVEESDMHSGLVLGVNSTAWIFFSNSIDYFMVT